MFSKKDSDTLPIHQKYNYQIQLEKEQKYSHSPCYIMFLEKLEKIKYDLEIYHIKIFIQASPAFFFSLISFIKKPSKEIKFCIDYWRLNTIIRKDRYSVTNFAKTLI